MREELSEWIGKPFTLDLDLVNFDFLPDFTSSNWLLSAIEKAQGELPALNLQAIFGRIIPSQLGIGNGDVAGIQMAKDPIFTFWDHEYRLGYYGGCSVEIDPSDGEMFRLDHGDDVARILGVDVGELTGAEALTALKEKDAELGELAEKVLAAFASELPKGATLPCQDCTAFVHRYAGREPEQAAKPELANNATWIVHNLIGVFDVPVEHHDDWVGGLNRMLEDPLKFGPVTVLRYVWASYFHSHRTEEILAAQRNHDWRVVRESVEIIEGLLKDPHIGGVRMWTYATLDEREAHLQKQREAEAEAAAAAAKAAAEAEEKKKQDLLDAGRLVLVADDDAPTYRYDRGFTLVPANELPDGIKHPMVSNHDNEAVLKTYQQDERGEGLAWAAKTASGHWIRTARTNEKKNGYVRMYQTSFGAEGSLTHLGKSLHLRSPHVWTVKDDVAYANYTGALYELDLANGSVKKLFAGREKELTEHEPVSAEACLAVELCDGGFWAIVQENNANSLRRYAHAPGGTPEPTDDKVPMWGGALKLVPEHDLFLIASFGALYVLTASTMHCFQVVTIPKNPQADELHFRWLDDGLYFVSGKAQFRILNLDKLDRSAGLSLRALADSNYDNVKEVPHTDVVG